MTTLTHMLAAFVFITWYGAVATGAAPWAPTIADGVELIEAVLGIGFVWQLILALRSAIREGLAGALPAWDMPAKVSLGCVAVLLAALYVLPAITSISAPTVSVTGPVQLDVPTVEIEAPGGILIIETTPTPTP